MSGISVVKGTRIKHSQKTGVVKSSSIMPAMLAAMGSPIGHTYEYPMRNIILHVDEMVQFISLALDRNYEDKKTQLCGFAECEKV